MPDRHDERAELLEQTLRSSLRPRRGATAADAAHRRGVLRSDQGRILTGACAAIGRSLGVGPRLVRIFTVCLTMLGPGPFLYCVAALLLPRVARPRTLGPVAKRDASVPQPGRAAPASSGTPSIEYPLRAMARGDVRGSEVLALLLLVPTLVVGLWWSAVIALGVTHIALLLAVLTAVVGILLMTAALHAARARQVLLLSVLAREAGLADAEELADVLTEAQRRAPHAWAMIGRGDIEAALEPAADLDAAAAAQGASPVNGDEAPSPRRRSRQLKPRRRPRPDRLSGRLVLAAVAGSLALGALTLLMLNAWPTLLPSVALAPLLPQVGRVAAASGAVALLLAAVLIVSGLRGRRSTSLVLIAALATTVAGTGAVWLRLTHDPEAVPVVLTLEDPDYGSSLDCAGGVAEWRRPIVIDLRSLDERDAERIREEAAEAGDDLGGISALVGCHGPVGRITVLMPEDQSLVDGGISTVSDYMLIGQGGPDAVVGVTGSLLIGDVTVVDHETAGDAPAEQWAAGGEER